MPRRFAYLGADGKLSLAVLTKHAVENERRAARKAAYAGGKPKTVTVDGTAPDGSTIPIEIEILELPDGSRRDAIAVAAEAKAAMAAVDETEALDRRCRKTIQEEFRQHGKPAPETLEWVEFSPADIGDAYGWTRDAWKIENGAVTVDIAEARAAVKARLAKDARPARRHWAAEIQDAQLAGDTHAEAAAQAKWSAAAGAASDPRIDAAETVGDLAAICDDLKPALRLPLPEEE